MLLRSKWIIWAPALAALLLAGILVPVARAGKFHFNSVNFSLGSLVMEGDLAGLGNQQAKVTLTAYGTVKAMCENKGGQQAPGRNPISINTQQTVIYFTDQNGKAQVEVIAPDPTLQQIKPSPTPKQAGCPNGNWKVVGVAVGSTNWTAAKVIVKDEADKIQINLSFTCTTTFSSSGVATSVSCKQS
jgi:hypothetical protein